MSTEQFEAYCQTNKVLVLQLISITLRAIVCKQTLFIDKFPPWKQEEQTSNNQQFICLHCQHVLWKYHHSGLHKKLQKALL